MRDLNTQIFLSDAEFARLFGPQIMLIVSILNSTAREVCPPCDGWCCENIKCLFYSKKFSACPIFSIRPRECRYHFCNDVFSKAPLTKDQKEQMVGPVEELVCGNRGEVAKLFFLFPEFPLDEKGLATLGIGDEVRRIVQAFEGGMIKEQRAFALLRGLCLKITNKEGGSS